MSDGECNDNRDRDEADGDKSEFARVRRELRLAVTAMEPGALLGSAGRLGPAYGVSRATMQCVLAALATEPDPVVVSHGKGQPGGGWRRAGGPPPRSVLQRAMDGVRADIAALAPGDRLGTLKEMAARYEVGTQAVQEAMRRLRAEGLVTSRGRGPTGGWLKSSAGGAGRPGRTSQRPGQDEGSVER
jgi:hypothetical protein